MFSEEGKKNIPFILKEIEEKRMFSYSNMVGVSANTASAYPPIFNGACVFPEKGDSDTTFLSLPTLARLTENLGFKTQTLSTQQTSINKIFYH